MATHDTIVCKTTLGGLRCPLHLASFKGHIEIVQEILTIYEDACLFHDQNGRIPIHYAAIGGRVKVVEKLIVARLGSVRVVLDGNETVLHLCVKYNQLKALDLLVKSLSDDGDFLNFKTSDDGNTILHLVVMQKQIEVAFYLFLEYMCKNKLSKNHFTPTHEHP